MVPHHNLIVYALMSMKFDTVMETDVCYVIMTEIFLTAQMLRKYDVIDHIYGAKL